VIYGSKKIPEERSSAWWKCPSIIIPGRFYTDVVAAAWLKTMARVANATIAIG
jgi:hypothetical protein